MEFVNIIIKSGRMAVEFSLFVMLPIMVVMLTIMRILEARGVLDWFIKILSPILTPLGLNGLGIFAALQISFVSFAAPVATLTMMEQRGVSNRHLAATLALVFAMAQANVVFPMASLGLNLGRTLLISVLGGLLTAAVTYYLFARNQPVVEPKVNETLNHPVADNPKGVLDVINRAGAEAFKIAVGAIPMLVLSLVAVSLLKAAGFIEWLTLEINPILALVGIDPGLVLPTLSKYLAGGTAMMGVMDDLSRSGHINASVINHSAGFLINVLDLPGIAIMASAGTRVAQVWRPAALGAIVGIAFRAVCQALLG